MSAPGGKADVIRSKADIGTAPNHDGRSSPSGAPAVDTSGQFGLMVSAEFSQKFFRIFFDTGRYYAHDLIGVPKTATSLFGPPGRGSGATLPHPPSNPAKTPQRRSEGRETAFCGDLLVTFRNTPPDYYC